MTDDAIRLLSQKWTAKVQAEVPRLREAIRAVQTALLNGKHNEAFDIIKRLNMIDEDHRYEDRLRIRYVEDEEFRALADKIHNARLLSGPACIDCMKIADNKDETA